MAAIANRSEFLSIVTESKLVDEDVLEKLRQSHDLSELPGECAEQLIQQGVLTRFQAKQLLAGKHRGFVLGPYRILDQIGKGGMGTVYLGEHATLKRRVAVKVLARELAENKAAVERFLREARSASSLTHQNIVRVHHVGQAGGTHYIVMEYVEGVTLEQVVDRKGPFSIAEAAQIAIQAATGLQHAHERGFVHRDIKPENLMITKDGMIKILDMGLTKNVTSASDNLTGVMNTKGILGTLDYLSPEQAIQGDVDARSDVYSLGATMFMLVTGHSPYDGVPSQQKLMQHQFGKVPLLSEYRSDAPQAFVEIVAKMMAKLPQERYANGSDVAVAFLPWTSESPGKVASLNMPSRILANPSTSSQSLTPTPRDESRNTQTDSNTLGSSRSGWDAVIRTPAPEATKGSSPQVRPAPKLVLKPIWWFVLAAIGSMMGIGAAVAVAYLK
jgi:eukaryotic-like serine/threonine-protein kinase